MESNIDFNEFLDKKNIDFLKFQQNEPSIYSDWKELFCLVHPDSFIAQKKFLINNIRRRFLKKNS